MVMLCKNRQFDNSKLLTWLNFDIVCINSDDIIPSTAKHDIILKWHFRQYYSHPIKQKRGSKQCTFNLV
jgi:hypothetical protein